MTEISTENRVGNIAEYNYGLFFCVMLHPFPGTIFVTESLTRIFGSDWHLR